MKNPGTKNCTFGKVASSFVSVIARISMYFRTISFSCSNLFVSELMFKLPIITLFTLLSLKFLIFNNGFEDAPLTGLSFAY